jgi:RimJ/RimL family protein N-acetyltransferase
VTIWRLAGILLTPRVVLGVMLERLTLPPRPALQGERVLVRGPRESDLDDRLCHPIDPEEEDGYSSAWRRGWDGRRYHTREQLTAARGPLDSSAYMWAVEYDRHCVGSAGLHVDTGQHCASYTVGLFAAAVRGRGLGREVTRLVLSWALTYWACTASSWRCWPPIAAPSAATWPAVSARKGSAGKPSYTRTAGKTSS